MALRTVEDWSNWLSSLFTVEESQQYAKELVKSDITEDELSELDHELLKEMNITNMKHRMKILKKAKVKPEIDMYSELESFFLNSEKWRQVDVTVRSEIIGYAKTKTSSPPGGSNQTDGKEENIHEQKAGEFFMKSYDETDSTSDTDEGFFCDSLEGIGTYDEFSEDGEIGRNRGTFFIFCATKNREGADKDVENFKEMAKELGFTDIRKCEDFTAGEISEKLASYRGEDHSKDDCVVCAISAHGNSGDKIVVNGSTIDLNDFVKHFSIQNCQDLKGKPKLIIVQACRGNNPENSNKTKQTDYDDKTWQENLSTNYKDLILASSTIPARAALRNPKKGSYYVRCLLEEVKESKDREICEILTNVNRRLGLHKFLDGNGVVIKNKKQMACFRSNLTKNLYLTRGQPQVSTPCSQPVSQPAEGDDSTPCSQPVSQPAEGDDSTPCSQPVYQPADDDEDEEMCE